MLTGLRCSTIIQLWIYQYIPTVLSTLLACTSIYTKYISFYSFIVEHDWTLTKCGVLVYLILSFKGKQTRI